MEEKELYDLRFPLGEFEAPDNISPDLRKKWIADISEFPEKMISITENLNIEQKNTRYRPGGWTLKQVVHHCADSHINALIRFKLSLTEDAPTIRPYLEQKWAEMVDGLNDDLTPSLQMIQGTHNRWTQVLEAMKEEEWKRTFFHPEHNAEFVLDEALGLYAWHCRHHYAHIGLALGIR